jgi:hypothetical protein
MCASLAERWIRWTTTMSVLLLAAIAAVVSYRHMYELALAHGESAWTAALVPLSVDGMIVASSMSLLLRSRAGSSGGWLPWLLLAAGSLASLGANVAAAEPTVIGRLIAAWPSFALIGAYEMLMSQIRAHAAPPTTRSRTHPPTTRSRTHPPQPIPHPRSRTHPQNPIAAPSLTTGSGPTPHNPVPD